MQAHSDGYRYVLQNYERRNLLSAAGRNVHAHAAASYYIAITARHSAADCVYSRQLGKCSVAAASGELVYTSDQNQKNDDVLQQLAEALVQVVGTRS